MEIRLDWEPLKLQISAILYHVSAPDKFQSAMKE